MKTDYSISDVNAVKQITDELFFKYTNDPYYLKKTLREIRSLVHQANLKADKLIEIDWFKDFNANEVLITLQKELPNLSWNIEENNPGYSFTSQLDQLHIEIKYIVNPSYSLIKNEEIKHYWQVDIYLNPPFYTLSNDGSRFIKLEVAINYVKNILLPIKKVFSNLQME